MDRPRAKLMELGQHYTHTELAPSSQALAKALVELEPLLWERDAIKHWLKPNPGGGKTRFQDVSHRQYNPEPECSSIGMPLTLKIGIFGNFRDI